MPKTKKRRPNGKRTVKPRGKARVYLHGLCPGNRMMPEFRRMLQGHVFVSQGYSFL